MSTILPIFTLVLLTHRSDCASRHWYPFNIIHLIRTRDNDNHSQHVERPGYTGPDENESHSPCGMPMRMIRIRPLRMILGWGSLSFTQKEKKLFFAWHEERILPGKSYAFVYFSHNKAPCPVGPKRPPLRCTRAIRPLSGPPVYVTMQIEWLLMQLIMILIITP